MAAYSSPVVTLPFFSTRDCPQGSLIVIVRPIAWILDPQRVHWTKSAIMVSSRALCLLVLIVFSWSHFPFFVVLLPSSYVPFPPLHVAPQPLIAGPWAPGTVIMEARRVSPARRLWRVVVSIARFFSRCCLLVASHSHLPCLQRVFHAM